MVLRCLIFVLVFHFLSAFLSINLSYKFVKFLRIRYLLPRIDFHLRDKPLESYSNDVFPHLFHTTVVS